MRKYLFIFKSQVMTNLQYVFNLLVGFIGFFIMIFILLNLWKYMYSDPNQLINGYSMNQMIWYVIITELLWSTLGGRNYCNKISDDVKGGNVAYNINKPYNYVLYCLSEHLGDCVVKGVIYTILGMLLGLVFLHSFPSITILEFLGVLLSMILATIISTLLITAIGLISFRLEDSKPFYWIYSKFILVLGTLFPIEYFPKVVQPILKFSPIYTVSYGPARLFVDFKINEFINIIAAQLIYIVIAYLLCSLIYKRGVKRLNVNGG